MWIRSYINIALIKYWGKKNENLKLPANSSISVTLNKLYTEVFVSYKKKFKKDKVFLNKKKLKDYKYKQIVKFMNFIRKKYHFKKFAKILIKSNIPIAAGFASSAALFSALAKSSTLHLSLNNNELSNIARIGSCSASRSIFGGFVMLKKFKKNNNKKKFLYASKIKMKKWEEFRIIICFLNNKRKKNLSTVAMRKTKKLSPFYKSWLKQSEKDFNNILPNLKKHNIKKVGLISQINALRMHAVLLSCNMWYFSDKTFYILNVIRKIQKKYPVFFTIDAGENVKIITLKKYVGIVKKNINKKIKLLVCKIGVGTKKNVYKK